MTLADRIIELLHWLGPLNVSNLTYDLNTNKTANRVSEAEVQSELHRMDDAGRVLMRNGTYRISEAERAKL